MNDLEKWNTIKTLYKDKFNIEGDLVELLSDSGILIMCASGSSNASISNILELDIGTINDVIKRVFDFEGWQMDLPLNPYTVFNTLVNSGKTLFKDFNNEVVALLNNRGFVMSDDYIKIMFRVCRTLSNIERDIERNWI